MNQFFKKKISVKITCKNDKTVRFSNYVFSSVFYVILRGNCKLVFSVPTTEPATSSQTLL